MLCPVCNHSLTPLTVNTSNHGSIEIEHCYYCGGVWFGHSDINRIPVKEALNLSRMGSVHEITTINGSYLCPKDKIKLTRSEGQSIPSDITVLICEECGGTFINKKELVFLKKALQLKLNYFKTWKIPLPSVSSVFIPVLIMLLATGGIFITVKNVQKAQEARVKAKEIIGSPQITQSQNNSVLISFTTSTPVTSSIVYKSKDDKEPHTIGISFERNTVHVVTITGLLPQTTYTFKIYVEEIPGVIIGSQEYSFISN